VTSASDCRLSGGSVSATSSQATPLTSAWSRGGKNCLTPPPGLVFQGKVPRGPPAAPPLHRSQMQLYPFHSLAVGHQRLLMSEQHQCGSLPPLIRNGPLSCKPFSLLQEYRWELRAEAREGTTHGRHPSTKSISLTRNMPLIVAPNLSSKTMTLFLKRSTKAGWENCPSRWDETRLSAPWQSGFRGIPSFRPFRIRMRSIPK
jgi:hypothetical protein